jgi:hypothetical protein
LAAHLAELLTNEPLWHRISVAGPLRVRRSFDLKAQARVLDGLYRESVERYRVENAARMGSYPKEATLRDIPIRTSSSRRP